MTSEKKKIKLRAYLLLLPAFLITLSLMVYPLFMTFDLSFRIGHSMSFQSIGELPYGLGNYTQVLQNDQTWESLAKSLIYTVSSTLSGFVLGLCTALLLNKLGKFKRLIRILTLLPWAVPGVIAAVVFLWMLDPSYGVVNYFLRKLGVISKNVSWFFDPQLAMFSVVLPTVWKGYPFFTLTILASLQGIPETYYEAARVDGASVLKLFRYITWPGIRIAAILSIILNALWTFRVFDIIFPITAGGPMGATETLAIRIYNEAFRFYQMGKASTLGILTLFICAVFVSLLYPLMKKRFY